MLSVAAPAHRLTLYAVLTLMIAAASILAALQTPRITLAITRVGGAQAVWLAGPDILVPDRTSLRFSRVGGKPIVFTAGQIADDAAPSGGPQVSMAHWRKLSTLSRLLGTGRADLTIADGRGRAPYRIASRPRTLATITIHQWSVWGTAIAALLAGLWVWAVRRRDWASRQFTLMSLGIFVSAIPMAVSGNEPLATPYWHWLLVTNSFGAMLFGAGLMGMLMRFPCRLLQPRWAMMALMACLGAGCIHGLEWANDSYQLIGIACLAIFAVLIGLMVAQMVAARGNTAARHAIRVITIVVCVTLTVVLGFAILPVVLRSGQPLHTTLVFPLLLIIHFGVASAVTRTRLVTLEAWTGVATRSAGSASLIVALDLLLILTAYVLVNAATALVAAGLAGIHGTARAIVGRRRALREWRRESELLGRITQLSLAVDAVQRHALWTDALQVAFSPLAIASDPSTDAERPLPSIAEDGRILRIPRTEATEALVLSHADGGRRRFDAQHLARATELHSLLVSTARARDEYVRGVTEERLRIARDLHDDVGARLLTSLYREDRDLLRQDVRDAISDIRLIVSNLAGNPSRLDEVLADLRHETFTRLSGAHVELDWPSDAALMLLPDQLSGDASGHLTSLVRELVSNAIRHGDPSTVTVRVDADADRLTIVFADDGRGIVETRLGNGLRNIERRAQLLGGSVRFHGPPGFSATVELPRRPAPSPSRGMADVVPSL